MHVVTALVLEQCCRTDGNQLTNAWLV